MRNEELLKELKNSYSLLKKEFKIKVEFDELDKILFLNNATLKDRFVPQDLLGRICSKFSELFSSYNNYLHSLIIPNPNYMISVTESGLYDEKEKEEIIKLMNQIMFLISKNNLNSLKKDKSLDAKFIDDAYVFYTETLNPQMQKIIEKSYAYWQKKSEEK